MGDKPGACERRYKGSEQIPILFCKSIACVVPIFLLHSVINVSVPLLLYLFVLLCTCVVYLRWCALVRSWSWWRRARAGTSRGTMSWSPAAKASGHHSHYSPYCYNRNYYCYNYSSNCHPRRRVCASTVFGRCCETFADPPQ